MAERKERRKTGRRKTDRFQVTDLLSEEYIEMLQDLSEKTGIPMKRLIEDALHDKYAQHLKS